MKRSFALMLNVLLLVTGMFMTNSAMAQMEMPEDIVSWDFSVEQDGENATVLCKVSIVDHWHINATKLPEGTFGFPTVLDLTKSSKFKKVGGVIEPKPIEKYDELADENLAYHEGTFYLKQKIKVLSEEDFEIKGLFHFQTCDDVKCLRDLPVDFTVKIKGFKEDEGLDDGSELVEDEDTTTAVVEDPTANDPQGHDSDEASSQEAKEKVDSNEDDGTSSKSIWVIFGLSFLSGLAALLTPCVFPMIPMTVSFFTKQSKTKAKGIQNAIIYGLSIIAIYILLGTVVTGVFGAEALNEMSTNPTFNIVFFLILIVFAISFLGAFEIRMPSKWVNKADTKADKGGLIGIFFMALALALVSFSCTGPIVGTLLVQAASEGGIAPFVGMFGFSLALALPFGLFAAFPGWMNQMPKSGGWLNSVKVVLGFLELALAFKFLSNADLAVQGHWLERELFLAIWIAIFLALTLYLFGKLTLPHDSPLERLSVGRVLMGVTTLIFVIYMLPGMWGAPLKLISAFPPPMNYSESPLGFGGGGGSSSVGEHGVDGTHLGPQNIMVFNDFDKAKAHAEEVGKPLFVDFTGHNCVNCRKMEQSVWGEPGIIDILKDDVIIVSLHVDERIDLPEDEQVEVTYPNGKKKMLKTTGDKWMFKQISEYKVTAQPYYRMLGPNGEDLDNGSADYEHHSNPSDFKGWLDQGLELYKSAK